jgi:hypothetical protein
MLNRSRFKTIPFLDIFIEHKILYRMIPSLGGGRHLYFRDIPFTSYITPRKVFEVTKIPDQISPALLG